MQCKAVRRIAYKAKSWYMARKPHNNTLKYSPFSKEFNPLGEHGKQYKKKRLRKFVASFFVRLSISVCLRETRPAFPGMGSTGRKRVLRPGAVGLKIHSGVRSKQAFSPESIAGDSDRVPRDAVFSIPDQNE
jgi:hypothetical protein